jgi:hypothetical protein
MNLQTTERKGRKSTQRTQKHFLKNSFLRSLRVFASFAFGY